MHLAVRSSKRLRVNCGSLLRKRSPRGQFVKQLCRSCDLFATTQTRAAARQVAGVSLTDEVIEMLLFYT